MNGELQTQGEAGRSATAVADPADAAVGKSGAAAGAAGGVVRPTGWAVRVAGGRFSVRVSPRSCLVVGCLLLVTAAVVVLSLTAGQVALSPQEAVQALLGVGDPRSELIVRRLRLPRILTGLLAGAALGAAGAIFQSLTRNPLGSPDMLGFTTAAATGALLQIIVFRGGVAATALSAAGAGMVAAVVMYLLAFRRGVQGSRLVLIGVGLAALLTSVNSYLIVRANIIDAMSAQAWLTGSLTGRDWSHVSAAAPAMAVLLPIALVLGRRLGMLELGDETATALGIAVERTRLALVAVAVALTAVATAISGPVAFVALAAPAVARRLTRSSAPGIAAAAVTGALLLTVSDYLAQRVWEDTPLPVGVVTSAVGGLYLAWLLGRRWRTGAF